VLQPGEDGAHGLAVEVGTADFVLRFAAFDEGREDFEAVTSLTRP
jgi:hypothetical protein